jgi:DNA-binding transcriptional MerR regulator
VVRDDTLSIGELARQAGVTVKTVRFYSDQGLLPEAARSGGGHRRYPPEALARLRRIRSLRALDVPVPEVGRALDRDDALETVVARQLGELGTRLAALRWREAALRLLHESPPEELTERLELVGAVSVPPSTAALAAYWRRLLPPRLSARLRASVVDAAVPQPPADPRPAQVLAFARLHALAARATDTCLASHRPPADLRADVLYDGLREAYALAAADLTAGRAPGPGPALDCYVAAYAGATGRRDSPDFRRALPAQLAAADHPVMARYWSLAAAVAGPGADPTLGAAEDWLRSGLDVSA